MFGILRRSDATLFYLFFIIPLSIPPPLLPFANYSAQGQGGGEQTTAAVCYDMAVVGSNTSDSDVYFFSLALSV